MLYMMNRRGRRLFWEVCEWFEEREGAWIFSFENICHALDLEPDTIRQGLHRWRVYREPTLPEERALPAGYRLRRAAG